MRVDRPATDKIRSLDDWSARAKAARSQSRTVVLANGVFDLFHVGHLRYLEAAAGHGDLLIVAVNSDRSTRAYKGPSRPIVPALERAEIVAGLGCVDGVLVFDAPDVREIIETLRPHVHAKGSDYTADSVPERDIVLGYGGKVAICGDPKNHSTTNLIQRLGSAEGRAEPLPDFE